MTDTSVRTIASWPALRDRLVQLAEPLAIFGVALVALWVLRRLALRWLRRAAAGQESLAGVFAATIRLPSVLWCLAGALAVALRYAELTERQVHAAGVWIVIFIIASLTLVAAAVAARMTALYGQRRRLSFAVAGLTRTLAYVLVLSIGAMVLMHYLGLDVRPLLTALGVGGLALGLALQDTLTNFFAGVHILAEEPVSVGHFIRLSTGEEGTVVDIGWRTTRLRTGQNNIIVVPNTRITSGILTNFDLPEARALAETVVVAGRGADAARVRDLILEEARAADGVLAEPPPQVLFDPGLTPSHQQYRLLFYVGHHTQRGAVASAIQLRLLERFRAEGVPLAEAYPPLTRS
jgi:small-conductance mechanosensitive channel